MLIWTNVLRVCVCVCVEKFYAHAESSLCGEFSHCCRQTFPLPLHSVSVHGTFRHICLPLNFYAFLTWHLPHDSCGLSSFVIESAVKQTLNINCLLSRRLLSYHHFFLRECRERCRGLWEANRHRRIYRRDKLISICFSDVTLSVTCIPYWHM